MDWRDMPDELLQAWREVGQTLFPYSGDDMDDDFTPEWQDGVLVRAGQITATGGTYRVVLALVEEDGQTDVHLRCGPVGGPRVDNTTHLVLRGSAGRDFLRLAVRAFRALESERKKDDE